MSLGDRYTPVNAEEMGRLPFRGYSPVPEGGVTQVLRDLTPPDTGSTSDVIRRMIQEHRVFEIARQRGRTMDTFAYSEYDNQIRSAYEAWAHNTWPNFRPVLRQAHNERVQHLDYTTYQSLSDYDRANIHRHVTWGCDLGDISTQRFRDAHLQPSPYTHYFTQEYKDYMRQVIAKNEEDCD